VPSSADGSDPAQRTVEAADLLYVGEAVTGWAALGWQGGRWFTGTAGDGNALLPVPLVTTRHLLEQPGIAISQEFLPPGERQGADGYRTGPEGRRAHRREQLVAAGGADAAGVDRPGRSSATLVQRTGLRSLGTAGRDA
jgi:hypothetical protein